MATHETTVRWQDTDEALAVLPKLDGIDYLKKMANGEIPAAPIVSHFGMDLTVVEHGKVVFECTPNDSHHNPIGSVHGGVVCTLLDSALGCAAHTTLPAGVGYTSVEIKVNYMGAVRSDSGPLRCTGRVTKPGRRITFAEGEVVDRNGKLVASASGTLLVFPLDGA